MPRLDELYKAQKFTEARQYVEDMADRYCRIFRHTGPFTMENVRDHFIFKVFSRSFYPRNSYYPRNRRTLNILEIMGVDTVAHFPKDPRWPTAYDYDEDDASKAADGMVFILMPRFRDYESSSELEHNRTIYTIDNVTVTLGSNKGRTEAFNKLVRALSLVDGKDYYTA